MRTISEIKIRQLHDKLVKALLIDLKRWCEDHKQPPIELIEEFVISIDERLARGESPNDILENFREVLSSQDVLRFETD